MRILYGGILNLGSTTEHRLRALRRSVTEDVVAFDYHPHLVTANPLFGRLRERLLVSSGITALNRALVLQVEAQMPDYVWLDKPIYIHPRTVRRLGELGARLISYMPDDPYGPRGDPIWRLFTAALPHYWAHVVTRDVTRREFLARGARRVIQAPFAFEPSIHFPDPSDGGGCPQEFDLIFVGSPYDRRAEWIMRVAQQSPGLRIGLYGPGWRRHEAALRAVGLECRPPVWNDAYRETVWRSRLALSFITRSNRDELSHKAIEIAACGVPVLLEPSPVHSRVFRHSQSAFFFSEPAQLSIVVREALSMSGELEHVGRAGAAAVRAAELSNDQVLARIFRELSAMAAAVVPAGTEAP
jgi:glycosyltransferase involved in cell wall biosynthesis